jgi:hypothetical protein
MKRLLRLTGLGLVLALSTSCATWLYTDELLGEPVGRHEPSEWNGAWLDASASRGLFWLRVSPDGSTIEQAEAGEVAQLDCGRVAFARIEGDHFVRRHRNWYLSAPAMDPASGLHGYRWLGDLAARKDGSTLLIGRFSQANVATLVRSGELPGEVRPDGSVVLRGLKPAHLERLFESVPLAGASVVVRLPDSMDPCRGKLF